VSLLIDSLLKERYRIKKLLGQSGMSAIYLAEDEVLKVRVAVKENLLTTGGHSRQFRREATILARLRHPNLPRVIDHFIVEESGEYLVMDYISGEDLREKLNRNGEALSEAEVVEIGATICKALMHLHKCKPPIIHRDIKPANIKITPEGNIILVDFGLAKVFQSGEMTATGAQGITAGYSPVEQYGQGTDERSDIYALGATLYNALTNRQPVESIERALGTDKLKPIKTINPSISNAVVAVVNKAMAIEAAERFQSAEDFYKALLEAFPLEGKTSNTERKQAVKKPESISLKAQQQEVAAVSSIAQLNTRKRKRLLAWLIPLVFLFAVVSVGVAFVLSGSTGGIFGPSSDLAPTQTGVKAVFPTMQAPTLTLPPAEVLETDPSDELVTAPIEASTPTFTAVLTPQGGGKGQVAFVSERGGGQPQIWLINVDGSDLQRLTNKPDGACQPAWSPNGQRLAYISPCDGQKDRYDGASLFILNMSTHVSELVSTFSKGDYDPAWSPDGRKIAFTSLQTGKPQIFVYDLAARASQQLMNRSTISRQPAWSPDGARIAFVAPSPTTNKPQVWLVDSAGESAPKLFSEGGWSEVYRPVWTPDGKALLFDLGKQNGIAGKHLVGSVIQIETSVSFPESLDYSSDGASVICDGVFNLPGRDIIIMLETGARPQRLTNDPAEDYQPAWRPSD